MRRSASLGLAALLAVAEVAGCSTVKWVYSDRATGETWWIKHSPLSADEITYCQPQPSGPVQCQVAQLLE